MLWLHVTLPRRKSIKQPNRMSLRRFKENDLPCFLLSPVLITWLVNQFEKHHPTKTLCKLIINTKIIIHSPIKELCSSKETRVKRRENTLLQKLYHH